MAGDNIKVVCRFRPINGRERKEQEETGIGGNEVVFFPNNQTVEIMASALGKQTFNFDRVFGPNTEQPIMFNESAKSVVLDIAKGFNGTIFAYGQTGAGKSWSMFGDVRKLENNGIIPRASRYMFEYIAEDTSGSEFSIKCSFLEIYNETINDLLNPAGRNLRVKESRDQGVFVDSLTETPVGTVDDIMECLDIGESARSVSCTQMNAVSSRSHSVFVMILESKSPDGATKKAKLNLVDLAGSEKIGKTGAEGQTLAEAKKINQSLSSLGNCINALVEGSGHIPFRNSKLTRILQDALGGNCKTTLLIACSPHEFNVEETLSTLKFGQRAKCIKLKAKVNAQRSPAEMMRMIDRLTKQVKELRDKNTLMEKAIAWYKSSEYAPGKLCPIQIDGDGEEGGENPEEEEGGPVTYDPEKEAVLQVKEDKIREEYLSQIQELKDEIEEMKLAENDYKEEITILHKDLQEAHTQLAELQDAPPQIIYTQVPVEGQATSTPQSSNSTSSPAQVSHAQPSGTTAAVSSPSVQAPVTQAQGKQSFASPVNNTVNKSGTPVAKTNTPVHNASPIVSPKGTPQSGPVAHHQVQQVSGDVHELLNRCSDLEHQLARSKRTEKKLEYDIIQLQHELETTQRNFIQKLSEQAAELAEKFGNQRKRAGGIVVKKLTGKPRTLHEASKEKIDLLSARRRLRRVDSVSIE
ncbi:hypothetical protein GEMRC1_011791 [Eukaryota sp. GEM-RC1]